jgi:hypothetical protein
MFFVPLVIAGAIGLAVLLQPWPLFSARGESSTPNTQTAEWNVARGFGQWVERQALARGLKVRGVARSVPIECPKCRKASNYFVYPDELCERCWRATLKPLPTPIKNGRL